MSIRIVRSVFTGPGREGDFSWMIAQPDHARSLFVFNDNEIQFLEHADGTPETHTCWPGGGNAAIRPHQCKEIPQAVGIPTGVNDGYSALMTDVRITIDRSLGVLSHLLATGRYDAVIYSWDANRETLGTGIFRVSRDVLDYIVNGIDAAAQQS